MSWFDGSGLKSFALSAINKAQKRIDKVLEIEDEKSPYETSREPRHLEHHSTDKKQAKNTANPLEISRENDDRDVNTSPFLLPPTKLNQQSNKSPEKRKKEEGDFSWDTLFAGDDVSSSTANVETKPTTTTLSPKKRSPRKRNGSNSTNRPKIETNGDETSEEIVIDKKPEVSRTSEAIEIDGYQKTVETPLVAVEDLQGGDNHNDEEKVQCAEIGSVGVADLSVAEESVEIVKEEAEMVEVSLESVEEKPVEVGEDEKMDVALEDERDEVKAEPQSSGKELAQLQELVDVREKQLLSARKENVGLEETNGILRNQLAQLEELRVSDTTDIDQLTKEFTERVSVTEQKFKAAVQERDQLKRQLQEQEKDREVKYQSDTSWKELLKEKTEQVDELMKEGESLSKQQLQNSTVIKKLRAKERQSLQLIDSRKQDIERLQQDLKSLEDAVAKKDENEAKYQEAVAKLNDLCEKQGAELTSLRSEHEDRSEKCRGLQMNLDATYREMGELRKVQAANESTAQRAALYAEGQAKEGLKAALDQQKIQSQRREEALLTQIEDLQHGMRRAEQQAARREENLRQEIADLQQRLQEGESRNQELSQSVSLATTPLLRQIENLQNAHKSQALTWERVEKNLTDRLADLNSTLVMSSEKERLANERVRELQAKLQSSESQLSVNRQEKSRLSAETEVLQSRCDLAEGNASKEKARCDTLQKEHARLIGELKREKISLEQQLDNEKGKVDALQQKVLALTRKQEMRLIGSQSASSEPGASPASPSSASKKYIRLPSQGEILERSLHWSGDVVDGARGLRDAGHGGGGPPALQSVVENLQALVKQKEGEGHSLQNEMAGLEKMKQSMGEELVTLTAKNDELTERLESMSDLTVSFQELEQRYNAVLQMYGEKEEQVEELRLDLEDVKSMYRTQINELLAKQP
eukprot:m.230413 g.230413  ORF g.230413 m.230413 type:complete len:930 (+) comp40059_c0_seq18:67-2856(+)